MAVRAIIKNGKPMAIPYKTKLAKDYQAAFQKYIQSEVFKQSWVHLPNKTQHFYVDCVFYFDRIDRDANNYFKVLLDAITDTQMIWLDDNVAAERVQGIFYDSKDPRIEITIKPVEYVGIFPTNAAALAFENKCTRCKRYSRNCQLLASAKTGRIQPEINELECSKYNKKN